jgi:hypothetical protein
MNHSSNFIQPYILAYKNTLVSLGINEERVITRAPISSDFSGVSGSNANPSQTGYFWVATDNPPDYNQGVIRGIDPSGNPTYATYSNSTYLGVRPIVEFLK